MTTTYHGYKQALIRRAYRRNVMKALFGFLGVLIFVVSPIVAWLTHIYVAIQALVSDAAVSVGYGILLAVGAFMPPVGVVHGVGIWFGWW